MIVPGGGHGRRAWLLVAIAALAFVFAFLYYESTHYSTDQVIHRPMHNQ